MYFFALSTILVNCSSSMLLVISETVNSSEFDSELLISFLFEHKGISSKRSIFFKLKELIRLVQFLFRFHKFNAS